MPSRYYKRNFIKGYFYHIYNRGSHKNDVFLDHSDYETFLEIIEYYLEFPQGKPLSWKLRSKNDGENACKVPNLASTNIGNSFSINCYCLMSNHFHLLIHQQECPDKENDITNFMRRLTITYAMYFNDKYEHSGNLFQGKYKNVLVNSDKQLLYLSKYIHQNPLAILHKNQSLRNYKYSSYPTYLNINAVQADKNSWLNKEPILKLISQNRNKQVETHRNFVESAPQILSLIEKVAIDIE